MAARHIMGSTYSDGLMYGSNQSASRLGQSSRNELTAGRLRPDFGTTTAQPARAHDEQGAAALLLSSLIDHPGLEACDHGADEILTMEDATYEDTADVEDDEREPETREDFRSRSST